jgi:hypothetical protein
MFVSGVVSALVLFAAGHDPVDGGAEPVQNGWVEAEIGRGECRDIEDEIHGDWAYECFQDVEAGWRIRSIENEHVEWFVFMPPTGDASDRLRGRVSPQGSNDCAYSQNGFVGAGTWLFADGEAQAVVLRTSFSSCSRQMELYTYQVIALQPDQPEIACLMAEVDGDLHAAGADMAMRVAEALAGDWNCATGVGVGLDRSQTSSLDEIIEAYRGPGAGQ